MNAGKGKPKGTGEEADEVTPLLRSTTKKGNNNNGKRLWGELRAVTRLSFTRYRPHPRSSLKASGNTERKSLRLAIDDLFADHHGMVLEPVDALSPLATGGVIVCTDKYRTTPRPPSTVKSLPAYAPFRRTERHRSFTLWWINEVRTRRYRCFRKEMFSFVEFTQLSPHTLSLSIYISASSVTGGNPVVCWFA